MLYIWKVENRCDILCSSSVHCTKSNFCMISNKNSIVLKNQTERNFHHEQTAAHPRSPSIMWNLQTALSCRRWQPAKHRTVPCRTTCSHTTTRAQGRLHRTHRHRTRLRQPRGQGARGPALRFARHRYSGPYKAFVETIHKNNTRVIAQINHAGSAAIEEITGYPAISASVTAQSGVCTQKRKARARNDRGRHAHHCKKVCRSRAA